ncbi:hypothetical protein [Actinoplanes sp. URMC 104]|uniref:hypothetical protein n=1 Tax=Actinoplanes sp. URMC 104 TaxID=3423409 RepID=UPI003F1A72A8
MFFANPDAQPAPAVDEPVDWEARGWEVAGGEGSSEGTSWLDGPGLPDEQRLTLAPGFAERLQKLNEASPVSVAPRASSEARTVVHAHGQHGMHEHSAGDYADHQRPIDGERFPDGEELRAALAKASRERDSLARRCSARYEETEAVKAELARVTGERDSLAAEVVKGLPVELQPYLDAAGDAVAVVAAESGVPAGLLEGGVSSAEAFRAVNAVPPLVAGHAEARAAFEALSDASRGRVSVVFSPADAGEFSHGLAVRYEGRNGDGSESAWCICGVRVVERVLDAAMSRVWAHVQAEAESAPDGSSRELREARHRSAAGEVLRLQAEVEAQAGPGRGVPDAIVEASRELARSGLGADDPRLAGSVLAAVCGFYSYPHTVESAAVARDVLMRLLAGEGLPPAVVDVARARLRTERELSGRGESDG